MPHFAVRQQRLLRIVELVLDQARPFARQRQLGVRHRRQQPQQIGAAQCKSHTAGRCGTRQIDRADARVRDRAPDESRMQHARQFEIGDELPLAGQQPPILAPQQRPADVRRSGFAHSWALSVLRRISSAPALTALTIFTYPVQRQSTAEIASRIASSVGAGLIFR